MRTAVPTTRTYRKFGRDLLAAMIAAGVVFVTDNVGDLELAPEVSTMIVAAVTFGWRWLRGYLGQEPREG